MACDMNKIANFSKEKQELIALCVDHYAGDLANFCSQNVKTDESTIDAQIRERIQKDILGGAELNHRTFRKYKNDIYEVIEVILEQTIPLGLEDNEIFNRFVETRRVDLGDINEYWIEDDSLFTVSRFSGNHWDTTRERVETAAPFVVPTSWYTVHFYNHFERFMKGLDSFVKLMNKTQKSFIQTYLNAIYTAFSNIADLVPDEFSGHGALSTDTEKENLLVIADKIATATGEKPIFVGASTALRRLQKNISDNWVPDSYKEARQEKGIVPAWEGYELLPLPQVFKKGTFEFELSNDTILIVSSNGKPVKFTYEGNARMKEVKDNTENMDMSLEGAIQVKAGVGVAINKICGSWKLA